MYSCQLSIDIILILLPHLLYQAFKIPNTNDLIFEFDITLFKIKRNMIMKLLWIVDIFPAHKNIISNIQRKDKKHFGVGRKYTTVLKKLKPAINQKFRKFSLEIIIFKNRQSNMFLNDVLTLSCCQKPSMKSFSMILWLRFDLRSTCVIQKVCLAIT